MPGSGTNRLRITYKLYSRVTPCVVEGGAWPITQIIKGRVEQIWHRNRGCSDLEIHEADPIIGSDCPSPETIGLWTKKEFEPNYRPSWSEEDDLEQQSLFNKYFKGEHPANTLVEITALAEPEDRIGQR